MASCLLQERARRWTRRTMSLQLRPLLRPLPRPRVARLPTRYDSTGSCFFSPTRRLLRRGPQTTASCGRSNHRPFALCVCLSLFSLSIRVCLFILSLYFHSLSPLALSRFLSRSLLSELADRSYSAPHWSLSLISPLSFCFQGADRPRFPGQHPVVSAWRRPQR